MNKDFLLTPLNLAISTAIMMSAIGLAGCEADNNDITANLDSQPIKKQMGSYSLVKAGSDEDFLTYYSSALRQTPNVPQPEIDMDNDVPVADNMTDGGRTKKISTTNLIEAGVDEVDFVKQNSTHIYTSTQGYGNGANDSIRVYAKPTTKPIAELDLGQSVGLKGFFLRGDNLYSFRQISHVSHGGNHWQKDTNNSAYNNGVINLETVDVSSPSQPNITKTYSWEGTYVDSRRIDDRVYVVSSSQLNDPWMCYEDMPLLRVDSSEEKIAADTMPYCGQPKILSNEDIIARMPVDINGSKVTPSDCFIPNKYNKGSNKLNPNITLITEVDLAGNNHKTTCISASAENFYMSTDALYLASQDYTNQNGRYQEKTIVNKFGLDADKVSYAGSGAIKGHINWEAASFSMSEYDDILRVVTSTWKDDGIYNMLHTLQESETSFTLETLATLPNKSQPASIGKPNERIKGVRFLEDEGYVVTFETKDPLYKIDLSDPNNPKIAGELEMPGYSAYLHRINDTYLLGVGYTTDDRTRADGVQVTVFDTSGDDPVIVDQDVIKIDTSNMSALNLGIDKDSRAITTLIDVDTMRLSIPYWVFKYNDNYQVDHKAVEYTLDLETGALTNKIERNNALLPIQHQDVLRSLISNDDIYYVINDKLHKYVWGIQ